MERDKFAGGDQVYLQDVQYRDPARLSARANLHARYTTATEPWFTWVARQIDWQPEAQVLEVGCGPGWLWAEAADELPPGLQLTLTDLSAGMVDAAAERVRALAAITLVEARAADAQALPFEPSAFDVVVANHMLYHLPEPGQGLAELARVCRPEGVLVTACNGADHLRELGEIRRAVFGSTVGDSTVDAFGVESGEPILRRHFDEVEWRAYPDVLACTDPDDVLAFITSAPPGEDATDDELRAVHELIERGFAEGDGVFKVTKDTGVFVARVPKT